MCLVDNLGALLAGTLTRISQIGAEYAAITWPGDQATIVLHGKRASAIGAAFANGCAANGIDIDDSARYAYGHAGAQIFSTALAVAEARGLSGAQLLTGLVVGYEIAHRVGRCWHASRPVYQACGSWGSVVCAAVAAHLMGLTAEQVWHALGIAEYHAPNLPMMRDVDHPAMVKHGIEWAAMTGIISAELAERGFTGIPGILSFDEYQAWGQDIGQKLPDGGGRGLERSPLCLLWLGACRGGRRPAPGAGKWHPSGRYRPYPCGRLSRQFSIGDASSDNYGRSPIQPGLAVGGDAGGWRDRSGPDAWNNASRIQ